MLGHSLWSIANIGSNRACGSPSGPQRQVRGPGSVVPRELYRNMEHMIFKGQDKIAWLRWKDMNLQSLRESLANHDAESQAEC